MSIEIGEHQSKAHTVAAARDVKLSEGSSAIVIAVRDVRLLLIALWLGAAVFFSFAVAPSAFSVLRSFGVSNANELAGAIVNRTLMIVNVGGLIISLLLLASAFFARRVITRRAFFLELASLALIAIATGVGQWVIAARMQALRAMMGQSIDQVAVNDPLRASFDSLHGYSVIALCVGMIAAAVALLLIARRANK